MKHHLDIFLAGMPAEPYGDAEKYHKRRQADDI